MVWERHHLGEERSSARTLAPRGLQQICIMKLRLGVSSMEVWSPVHFKVAFI